MLKKEKYQKSVTQGGEDVKRFLEAALCKLSSLKSVYRKQSGPIALSAKLFLALKKLKVHLYNRLPIFERGPRLGL